MLSRRESLLDNFRFIVFGSVLLIGLSVSARTVALWPIEWDPQTGEKDLRCAVDPQSTTKGTDMEYYTAIGIDVSDKTSKICVMTKSGGKRRIVLERTVETTKEGLPLVPRHA